MSLAYFYLLLALINFSIAIVIEGVSFVGAITSTLNPASSAACLVETPKTAIFFFSLFKFWKILEERFYPLMRKKRQHIIIFDI